MSCHHSLHILVHFVVMQKHRAGTTHSSTISRPHDKTWTQDSKSSTPRICMLPWAFRWWPTAHHQGPPRTAAIGPHSVPQEIELWLNYVVSDRSVLQNESWFQVCFNCEIGLNSQLICTTTSSEAKSVGLGPCSLTSKSVHFGMHLDYTFHIIRHHGTSWSMTSLSPSAVDLLWGKDWSLEALSFRHRLHGSLVLPCEQQRARWTFWR